MIEPSFPKDEVKRLASLRASKLLDTAPEERFDRLTRMARKMFSVPMALVSLVDEHRQWFKSAQGVDACETPRSISFCGHAILGSDLLIVTDARLDPRFHDNPLVTGEPHIRFYAGCPLQGAQGYKLGTLCLIDTQPREFDQDDRTLLKDLAAMAEQELVAVQLAMLDELTMISNRRCFLALSEHMLAMCRRNRRGATLLLFDLDNFKPINDTYGHAEGDRALIAFADLLRDVFRESDLFARIGGDEFVALLTATTASELTAVLSRLRQALADYNSKSQRGYAIDFSVGSVTIMADDERSIEQLLATADKAMYAQKRKSARAESAQS